MHDGRTLGRNTTGETESRASRSVDAIRDAVRSAHPITAVTGAAGAGKTHAVHSATRGADFDVFWVSLDHDGTTLFAFLKALIEAIAPIARGAQLTYSAMQSRLGRPARVRQIAAWLSAHIVGDALVVVDNVELFASDPHIREFFIACVDGACPSIRWLFVGRTLDALPVEAWLPYDTMSVPIVMQQESRRDAHRLVGQLDARDLVMLTRMAPLASCDIALLGNVLGADGVKATAAISSKLPSLFEAGAPLCLHRDVRAAILERCAREGISIEEALSSCGAALESVERYEELVALYTGWRKRDALLDVCTRYGIELVDRVSAEGIEAALALIGEGSIQSLILHAFLESRRGRYDLAESYFLNAVAQAEPPLRSRLIYAYGCDLLRRNRADSAALFEQLLVRDAPPQPTQAEVRSALAQAYIMAGRRSEAIEQIKFAVRLDSDSQSDATVMTRAAYVYFYASGDLQRAEQFAARALASAQQARAYTTAVGAASILYNIACERDRPGDALSALDVLADCGTKLGNLDFQVYAIVASLEYYVESADVDAIARATTALRSFDVAYESLLAADALLVAEAMQLGWRGEFERGYDLLAPSAVRCIGDDFIALRHAQLAAFAAAAHRTEDALEHLRDVDERLDRLDPSAHKPLRTAVLAAIAASACNQRERAERYFAFASAGAQHFPRLAQFRDAARLLHERWIGRADEHEVLDALLRLRERRAGGLALLLAQFPASKLSERKEAVEVSSFARLKPVTPIVRAASATAILHERDLSLDIDEVDAAIDRLLVRLDSSDALTAEHSRAVGSWCARIARALGLDEREVRELERAGLVHDVGKLSVPAHVLAAPRSLSEAEWEIVRAHVIEGDMIAQSDRVLAPFRHAIRYHHERLDGSGYPEGLRGTAIPFQARVVSVADSFNAMIGRRPYRPALPAAEAIEELVRTKTTLFDPEIIEALCRVLGV